MSFMRKTERIRKVKKQLFDITSILKKRKYELLLIQNLKSGLRTDREVEIILEKDIVIFYVKGFIYTFPNTQFYMYNRGLYITSNGKKKEKDIRKYGKTY